MVPTPRPVASILCVGLGQDGVLLCRRALGEHELCFVSTADEAIRAFHRGSFDLYLCSFWLPDWAGTGLSKQFHKDDPNAPVLMCLTAEEQSQHARALRAGASDCVCLPMDPPQLAAQVKSHLKRAEINSLFARLSAQRIVDRELSRRLGSEPPTSMGHAWESIERTSRAKADRTFLETGGTRANFERWWPEMFSTARAAFSASISSATVALGRDSGPPAIASSMAAHVLSAVDH